MNDDRNVVALIGEDLSRAEVLRNGAPDVVGMLSLKASARDRSSPIKATTFLSSSILLLLSVLAGQLDFHFSFHFVSLFKG